MCLLHDDLVCSICFHFNNENKNMRKWNMERSVVGRRQSAYPWGQLIRSNRVCDVRAWCSCDSACEMNGLVLILLLLLASGATPAPAPHVDNNATSTSHTHTDDDDADTFLLQPEPVPDGKPHHLEMGFCNNTDGDGLLHSETLIVNNDGTSRVAGDIRVYVEAAVNITCFKVLDQNGEASGAFPSYKQGGLGHNYVVLGFDTAFGYGFNFLVKLYGHDLNTDKSTTKI